jgi:hypothetical protein
MKKIIFILSLSLAYLLPQAQTSVAGSWKIKWNKKIILETNKSDETANTKKIKAADLKKKYLLEISYNEADAQKEKEWKRSFMILDENDNELLRKDSIRHVTIAATELKKLFGNKKKIKIYTSAIPTDPDLAARARVRIVYMCTLVLQ